MAIPFYNQVDQDIYEGGEHYIPQQQYRLNYNPSTALASTVGNTGGITNTNVAQPIILPPQGGGDGGGRFHNVYGYDPNVTKEFDIQTWDRISDPVHDFHEGDYGWVDKTVTGYKSPSGWKTEKGKNIHNLGIDYTPAWAQALGVGTKIQGNRPGEIKGTFSDAENAEDVWDITKEGIADIKNKGIFKTWKQNQEMKLQKEIEEHNKKAAADAAAATAERSRNVSHYSPGGHHLTRSQNQGGLGLTQKQAQSIAEANEGLGGWKLAQGGRVGLYAGGDPEEAQQDLNIYQFMQDQGVPYGDMASAVDPMDALNDMSMEVFGKPLHQLTGEEYQMLIDMANDQAMAEQPEGLASLV